MTLALEVLTATVMACAPLVAPDTAIKLIRHESGGNPYAIGINGPYKLSSQPTTQQQAVATAHAILKLPGVKSIDVGLAMINNTNFSRFGLTIETAFDQCSNVSAMQRHLQDSYQRAASTHGHGQKALQAALSEYNTGHQTRGLTNGYVRKIYLQPMK